MGPSRLRENHARPVIARRTHSDFVAFSAVLCGIHEIKEVMASAEHAHRSGKRTIVFVDEVHRFNKAQQDAFFPHVEAGNITLIGATTENPSFEVIAPLLSRTRVYMLHALGNEEISACSGGLSPTKTAGWAAKDIARRWRARTYRHFRQWRRPRRL